MTVGKVLRIYLQNASVKDNLKPKKRRSWLFIDSPEYPQTKDLCISKAASEYNESRRNTLRG